LCLVDADGVFLWMNAPAKSLLADVIGQPIRKAAALELSRRRRPFAGSITGEKAATTYDLAVLDRAGRPVPVRFHALRLAAISLGISVQARHNDHRGCDSDAINDALEEAARMGAAGPAARDGRPE
jgi:hypothetical protein